MGFNAGSITAYLTLDRTQFDEGLEQAKADAEEWQEQGITVPLKLDTDDFDVDAAEVDTTKEALEEPIEIPASIDNEELAASALEAEAIIEGVKESAADTGAGGLLSLGPANLEEEAEEVEGILDDIGLSASQVGGGQGLVNMLLDTGATADEALAGLRNLGFSASEASSMLAAQQLVDAIMPSPAAIATAAQQRIDEGFYELTSASSDPLSTLYSIIGGPKEIAGGTYNPLDRGLEQLALPPGAWGMGEPAALPPAGGSFASFIDAMSSDVTGSSSSSSFQDALEDADIAARQEASALRTAALNTSDSTGSLASRLLDAGVSADEVGAYFKTLGMSADDVAATLGAAGVKVENEVDEAGGLFSKLFKAMFGAGGTGSGGGIFGSLDEGAGSLSGAVPLIGDSFESLGIPGLSVLSALAPSLGLAAAGGLAGTSIGTAGALWSLLPGVLDLYKGYEAYSGSTANPTANASAVASAIKPLASSGSSLLGNLENEINPEVVTFLQSFAKALQSVAPFAQTAVTSMSGFFDTIDRGLSSGGFKNFMAQMTADVGPIMDAFGQTIINAGKIFGDFLKVFGGGPAQMVGSWFVSVTGKLADFASHWKITQGEMSGARAVFSAIGAIFDLVAEALSKLVKGLAPVGILLLDVAKPAAQFAEWLLKMIPPQVINALFLLAVAIAMLVDPVTDAVISIMLLAAAGEYLRTHWKEIWTDIENWALDAWHAVDGDVIQPMVNFFTNSVPNAWDHFDNVVMGVWTDIKNWSSEGWQFLDGDVIQPMVTFFTSTIPNAWDSFKNTVNSVWQWVDGNVFQPIADFFTHTFESALSGAKSLWDSVWNDVESVLKTVWSEIEPILHDISSAVSTITGGVGSILSAGSSVAHLLGFASGGSFSGNSPILVGENGPELIFPKAAGYVVPNNRLNLGGASNSSGLTIYVDARGASDSNAVRSAATSGVTAALPQLRSALESGSGSLAGLGSW